MQTIGARARVVVVDRRRLIREGLPAVLRAVSGVEVVAAVAGVDDLDCVHEPFDAIVTNLPCTTATRAGDIPVLTYSDTQTLDTLLGVLTDEAPAAPVRPEGSTGRRLTPREVQVMRGIADGLSSAEIADGLEIAPKSVENHKQRIFAKLHVRSQAHAVTVSLADGLLMSTASVGRFAAGPGGPIRR